MWQGSKRGNRDTSGSTVGVAKSRIMALWPKVVDAEMGRQTGKIELIRQDDRVDMGGGTKKEGSRNVRLLVWVADWMVRPFTEGRKTKWGQVRESRVTLWLVGFEMPIKHPHGDVNLIYGKRETAERAQNVC